MAYGIRRLGYLLIGQDYFLKGIASWHVAQGLGTNGKKRPEACTSKWNVGRKPRFVTLHSPFFFDHVTTLPFAVQTLVLVSPSVPKSRDKRGLEKGSVCAWGG